VVATSSPRPQRNIRVRAIRSEPPAIKQLAKALIALAEDLARQDIEKAAKSEAAKKRPKS
jgi:hypothetical protein